MADLEGFLQSPITALVFTAIAAAFGLIALSGRFTIVGYILLAIAWLAAGFGLRTVPLPLLVSSLAILAGAFGIVAYYLTPDGIPAFVGMLRPKTVLLSVGGRELPNTNWIRALQIGDSESVFIQKAGTTEPLLKLPNGCFFELERDGAGRLLVSTTVRDKHGNLIAEIIRNEWKASKGAWDRNYNKNAFEIRGASGDIVLQVVLFDNRIQLQGEWWGKDGTGIRIQKMRDPRTDVWVGAITKLTPQYDPPNTIQPLFRYSSEAHFGELR